MTAAIYGCRYGFSVTVLEKLIEGGQLATTPDVQNYPGFTEISGYELAVKMKEQAKNLGANFVSGEVLSVELDKKIKKIKTSSEVLETQTVIFATGAKRRKLGCKGEDEFAGRGVSYCATCDGAFFKGKEVLIVGGGNTALEDAVFLAKTCSKVYMVHRRDEMRGMKALVTAAESNPKIEILYSSQLAEIKGASSVNEAVVTKNGITRVIPVSGVFIAVGTEPDTKFLQESVPLDESGYIVADESCTTGIEGVYAAGDCRKKPLRQIVTATADGAVAAFEAASYLSL